MVIWRLVIIVEVKESCIRLSIFMGLNSESNNNVVIVEEEEYLSNRNVTFVMDRKVTWKPRLCQLKSQLELLMSKKCFTKEKVTWLSQPFLEI